MLTTLALVSLLGVSQANVARHASAPSPRSGAYMVYDAARGVTILFGGNRTSSTSVEYPSDLWAWDGNAWRQLEPLAGTPRPTGRDVPVLAYDAARQRVVMFGGRGGDSAQSVTGLSDVWEWDGARWYHVPNSHTPNVLHPTATYDPVRQRVLLYGGGNMSSTGAFAGLSRKLWEWDGTRWTLRDSAGPENRYAQASSVTATGTLVLLTMAAQPRTSGGRAEPEPSRAWTWSATGWKAEESGPPFNNLQAANSAPDGTLYFYQSWEDWLQTPILHIRRIDGVWKRIEPVTNPGIRLTSAGAWDSRRKRFVLFGGMTRDRQYLDDTWELDGERWIKR
jgi:hypothetical protein